MLKFSPFGSSGAFWEMNEIKALKKEEHQRTTCSSHHLRTQQESAIHENWPLPDTESTDPLILDFPAYEPVRNSVVVHILLTLVRVLL